MRVEIKDSGPLKVAVFEGVEASLENPNVRAAVLKELETQPPVHQVVLRAPVTHVFCTERLSVLAHTIARAKRTVLDESYYPSAPSKRCRECIREQKEKLLRVFAEIERNPHRARELKQMLRLKPRENTKKCRECVEKHLAKLLRVLNGLFAPLKFLKELNEDSYPRVFEERQKPFFVEGVWSTPPKNAKLIDSYKLRENRGIVKIYERPNNPIGFYELELPEFKLPSDQLALLYRAFNYKLEEAPGHARFAYSDRMFSFAQDWYLVLLHLLKEKKFQISNDQIERLANMIARWLTYRVLDPFAYDDYITDIYVSAPPELQPIYVEHERWGKLETGIRWDTPSVLGLGEVLASRLGSSFDEVRPQLDAEIPELGMRLFLSRYPAIWARSVELAVRKRRSNPWTQPLFLSRRTLTPLASSFLSNVLRLGSSVFVIGEMGTAKTSQVETYIPEIGPQHRIVTFQDTEELHVEEFLQHGYKIANVRISDPEHLERQINAFLRGGASYWLITEVREASAVRAALGAAARQGSQPVVASFHARSKREVFDLVVHIMGLHEAAFRYIDLIVSTARFSTPSGTIRRIVEIAEVRKDWREEPRYVELFADDRSRDLLLVKNLLVGDRRLIKQLNSFDLSKLDLSKTAKKVRFAPPSRGGSHLIPELCRRLGIKDDDFLKQLLLEARVKSDLLQLSKQKPEVLELPFVSKAYGVYFTLLKQHGPHIKRVLGEWRAWLKKQ